MTIYLLINIGNSDLLADGQRPRAARPDGKALWESYEQHQFALPIIEPCLRELLGRQGSIDSVLLFATDQQPTGAALETDRFGVSLRDKDTVWYGAIIERYLREQFPGQLDVVRLVLVTNINPSLYDEAFDAYGRLLAARYDAGVETCYVLMAGGIPACNTALQLQAISCYGERCRTMYQPERGEPYELRVGAQVLATFRRATVIDALQRLDFAAAKALAPGVADAALTHLIGYAHYRECFDFERAQQSLNEGIRLASGEVRAFLNGLRHELDDVMARADIGALLRELLANAVITYRNGRYADFLGRVFRFQEAALRSIVEQGLGLPTDMSKERVAVNGPAFVQGIDANLHLKEFMNGRTVGGASLRYEVPNLPVLQALLDFLVLPGLRVDGTPYLSKGEQGRYGEVRKRLNKLNTFAQLRNQSVIAHGFAGVSSERLAEVYGGDDPLKDVTRVAELLGVDTGAAPFARIATFVIQQLHRGEML